MTAKDRQRDRAGPFPYEFADICVLVPAFNEELVIRETIESILETGIPPGHIFVLDDCSSDNTGNIARASGIRVFRNEHNLGKPRTIECAVRELAVRGEFKLVAVLDADTMLDRDFFAHILRAFSKNPDAAAVGGRPKSRPKNWLTAWRAFEYASLLAIYKRGQSKMGVIMISPGCATVYSTAVIAAITWHHGEIIIEDADASAQIHRRALGPIVYEPEAIVYTQDPHTLEGYIGQINRWYTATWQTMRAYRIPFGFRRIDAEFALVVTETFLYCLAVLLLPVWLILDIELAAKLLCADQVITAVIVCFFAISERRWDILLYSPLFLIPRFINCLVFIGSFVNTIILRKKLVHWFTPMRYAQEKKGGLA